MATIVGNNKDNILYNEGDFDDFISGGNGNDIILGLEGDDVLAGQNGRDNIQGGSGDDRILGGSGNDRMEGGPGEDTFVFTGKSGKDTIVDFDVDNDLLQIKARAKIKTVDDVVKAAKQKGDDLVIDLGKGNKITLKGVDKADFANNPGDHIEII